MAVQLVQLMRHSLQTDIPLAVLFQYPTIAALAEWLQLERKVSASPFVKLRECTPERAPLCLLHTGSGHVWGYHALVAALDSRESIYGIQMRATENPSIDAQDFDTVVQDYAALLSQQNLRGAYRLLGWSLGGLIALGVAARLESMGKRVGFVGLIDTLAPPRFKRGDWKERLADFLLDDELRASFIALPDHEMRELELSLAYIPASRRTENAALWGRERGLWLNHIPIEFLRLEAAMWRHVAAIEDSFEAPRLSADLHLWWASGSLGDAGAPPADWAALAGTTTHVTIIDTDHDNIISSPQLHESLQVILSKLDA